VDLNTKDLNILAVKPKHADHCANRRKRRKRPKTSVFLLRQQIWFQARRRSRQNRPVFDKGQVRFSRFSWDFENRLINFFRVTVCYLTSPAASPDPLLRLCDLVAKNQSSRNFFLRGSMVPPTVLDRSPSDFYRLLDNARKIVSHETIEPSLCLPSPGKRTERMRLCNTSFSAMSRPVPTLIVKKIFFQAGIDSTCPIGFVKLGVNDGRNCIRASGEAIFLSFLSWNYTDIIDSKKLSTSFLDDVLRCKTRSRCKT